MATVEFTLRQILQLDAEGSIAETNLCIANQIRKAVQLEQVRKQLPAQTYQGQRYAEKHCPECDRPVHHRTIKCTECGAYTVNAKRAGKDPYDLNYNETHPLIPGLRVR